MRRLITILAVLLVPSLASAVDMATITGTLLKPNGAPCQSCKVSFRTPYAQTITGVTFPAGQIVNSTADAAGVLPSGIELAQTLIVEVTIGSDQPKLCTVSAAATMDISACVGAVPDVADINSVPGILEPGGGGTGVGVIASCDANDEKLETGTDGSFSCGTNPAGGAAFALDELTDVDAPSPADGNFLRYDVGGPAWVNAFLIPGDVPAAPLDCDPGEFAKGLDNSLVLDCAVPAGGTYTFTADTGGTTAGTAITLAGGAGIATTRASDTVTFAFDDSDALFPTVGECSDTNDKLGIDSGGVMFCDSGGFTVPSGLDDLGDVTITAPADGDFLRSNGLFWVDTPLVAADIPAAPADCTTPGEFVKGIDADLVLDCAAPSGSGDITSVFDCASGACTTVLVTGGQTLGTSGGTITATTAASATSAATALTGDDGASFFVTGLVDRNRGGTGTDMSLTGSTGHVVKQTSANGALTTGLLITNNFTSGSVDAAALGADSVGSSELADAAIDEVAAALDGAGLAVDTSATPDEIDVASGEQGFLASGALTCGASTNGKMQVHTTPLQYCDNAGTPTLRYAAYGDSAGVATSATTATSATGLACTTCVDLTTEVTGRLPYANLVASTAASKIIGRTDASAGDWQEITLGTNLSMSGTTLNATGGGGASTFTADSGGTATGSAITLTGGAGIDTSRATDTITFVTDSSEQNFLASGALTCGASTAGKMQVHNAVPLQYCDNSATPTLRYASYADVFGIATQSNSVTTAGTSAISAAIDGVGLVVNTTPNPDEIDVASGEQGFLTSGALTCGASTNGKMQVHTTPLQYCDNAGTPTLRYAAYGDSTGVATSATTATTASALSTAGVDTVAAQLDGDGLTVNTATTPDELAVLTTEITGDRTWSTGAADSSITWTWDLIARDPALKFEDGAIELSPALSTLSAGDTTNALLADPTIALSGGSIYNGFKFAPTINVSSDTGFVTALQSSMTVNATSANTASLMDGVNVNNISQSSTDKIPPFPLHNVLSKPTVQHITSGTSIASSMTTGLQADGTLATSGTGALSFEDPNQLQSLSDAVIIAVDTGTEQLQTAASHGLTTGDGPFYIALGTKMCTAASTPYATCSGAQASTAALPGGVSARTSYWVSVVDADEFKLATSYANAIAGTSVVDLTAGFVASCVIGKPSTGLTGLRVMHTLTEAGGDLRADTLFGVQVKTPVITGTPSVGHSTALYVEEQANATITSPCSLCSVGRSTPMKHLGKVQIGGYTDAGPPSTTTLELDRDLGSFTTDVSYSSISTPYNISYSGSTLETLAGLNFNPTVGVGANTTTLSAVAAVSSTGMTVNRTGSASPAAVFLVAAGHIIDTSVSQSSPANITFSDASDYRTTAAATSTSGSYRTVNANPLIRTMGASSTQTTTAAAFRSAPRTSTDNASGTLNLTWTHFEAVQVSESATVGTENVTQIGLDIPALTGLGTGTATGIRNADTTVLTPNTQVITDAVPITPTASVICMTAVANRDLTSSPQIEDGQVGQRLLLVNCDTSTETIKLDDAAGLQLVAGTSFTMNAGDNIEFIYLTAASANDWFEISRADVN